MSLTVTGRLYVSGASLWWVDADTTIDERRLAAPQSYKFTGATPSSSVFSAQPAGRIWVASGSGDTALYYSDAAGVTRFISGIKRGAATASPAGRIYVHRFNKAWTWEPIQPGTDLFWATYSGSTVTWYSVKNDTSIQPRVDLELNIATYGDKGIAIGLYEEGTANLKAANFDIVLNGPGVNWYSSSNCTGTDTVNAYFQNLNNVIIPAGVTVLYVCPDNGDGGNTTNTFFWTGSGTNPCPAVNILGTYTANSWRVEPYTAKNNPPTLRAYTGSTMTTSSQTLGGLYYTSSTNVNTVGSLYNQTYLWPDGTGLGSGSTGDTWILEPLSIGIDRVAISFSDLVCSGTEGNTSCGVGSGSCSGTCYPVATKGCCGTTIYDLATDFCCNNVLGQYAQNEFCCGGSIYVNDGINYTGLCCSGVACGPASTFCDNGVCDAGTQP